MNFFKYFNSIAGFLFLLLLIGSIGSASLALSIADWRQQSDLQRRHDERSAESVQDFIAVMDHAPEKLRPVLLKAGIPGVRPASGKEKTQKLDAGLTRELVSRLGPGARAEIGIPSTCFPQIPHPIPSQLECRVISATLADKSSIRLLIIKPNLGTTNILGLAPAFLSVLALATAVLTFFASRTVASPLTELARAASALGSDLDRAPLSERGPKEVREAARAFNAMQAKLRDHLAQRTHILAAITHDLQTPLTRLRLRLEKVENKALKSRLIEDWAITQVLIRQGLDFYRGSQTEEPFVRLALDSLLESVVEDAAEGGRKATLIRRSDCDVEARLNALQRCLSNLIDNALKYGGSAELSAIEEDGKIRICIRDHGPGIPPEKLALALEPFVRLDSPTPRAIEGLGLGLSIARVMAEKNDAELELRNHPDGGLVACLIIRRGVVRNGSCADQLGAAPKTENALDA
jgi:signal transduction histidine kinase